MIDRPSNNQQQQRPGGGGGGGKKGSILDDINAGAILGGIGRGMERVILYALEGGKDFFLSCLAVVLWMVAIVIATLVAMDVAYWGTYYSRMYPEGRYVGWDWSDIPVFSLIAATILLLIWLGVKLKQAGTFSDNREKVERAVSPEQVGRGEIVVLPQIEDKVGSAEKSTGSDI